MDLIILLTTEILLGVMIYIEYRNYGMVATPTTVLGGVYFLFVPIINTIGQSLGFLKIGSETMIYFTLFVFIVFMAGMLFSYYYRDNYVRHKDYGGKINAKLEKKKGVIWALYLFSLLCYVISLIQVIQRYGINNTKSNAFGPFAHVGFLSRCLLPVIMLYFINERKFRYLVAAAVNIVALIMFQGKYHLFIPVAGFIVLYLITKRNMNIAKIFLVVIGAIVAGLVLFVLVYTVIPNIISGDTSWESMSAGMLFSTRHFFHYLFCPFICSNKYFANPVYRSLTMGMRTNLNAFDTLLQQFTGSRQFFSPVIELWPVVDDLGTTANVGGLFSESVLNVGYGWSVVYVGVISVIVYYFSVRCLLKGKRIITMLCLSGMMMMSFFCNYFSLLPNIECAVYCYLFDVVLMDNPYRVRLGDLHEPALRLRF